LIEEMHARRSRGRSMGRIVIDNFTMDESPHAR
jgi:hypothetical protein